MKKRTVWDVPQLICNVIVQIGDQLTFAHFWGQVKAQKDYVSIITWKYRLSRIERPNDQTTKRPEDTDWPPRCMKKTAQNQRKYRTEKEFWMAKYSTIHWNRSQEEHEKCTSHRSRTCNVTSHCQFNFEGAFCSPHSNARTRHSTLDTAGKRKGKRREGKRAEKR